MTDPTTARDALIAYAATTRTVTADGLAPFLDAFEAAVRAAGPAAVEPPADLAAVLHAAADAVRDGDLGPRGGMSRDYENGWWNSRAAAEDRVRRMADKAQQDGAQP